MKAASNRIWTINGRFLSQALTGVQRYARQITLALDTRLAEGHPLARALRIRLVVPRGVSCDLKLRALTLVETPRAPGYLWEQFILPAYARDGLLSLGNVGPLAVRRQIVCMHDTTVCSCPESFSAAYRLAQSILQPWLARRVAGIATVSHFSAAELHRYSICRDRPSVLAPNGHEHVTEWRARHSDMTRQAAGPHTIVVLGSFAPHKNVGLLLGMADDLAHLGLRLAVVGSPDPRIFAPAQNERSPSVIWLGRLSDGEVAALVKDSLCLAMPSLTEGFGLPALEAMALGCPVVASARASLPEVCGEAALFASPTEPEAWLQAFKRLRDDPALRRTLIDRGLERARTYSWLSSADRYLEVMAALDGAPSLPARPFIFRNRICEVRQP